jgi:hypothetical protein
LWKLLPLNVFRQLGYVVLCRPLRLGFANTEIGAGWITESTAIIHVCWGDAAHRALPNLNGLSVAKVPPMKQPIPLRLRRWRNGLSPQRQSALNEVKAGTLALPRCHMLDVLDLFDELLPRLVSRPFRLRLGQGGAGAVQ